MPARHEDEESLGAEAEAERFAQSGGRETKSYIQDVGLGPPCRQLVANGKITAEATPAEQEELQQRYHLA